MESQELIINEPQEQNAVESVNEESQVNNVEQNQNSLSLKEGLERAFKLQSQSNEKEEKKEETPIETDIEPNQENLEKKEDNEESESDFKLIPKEWNEKERQSFEALKDNPETKDAYNVLINRYENMRKDYHKKNQERSELAKSNDLWNNALDEEAKESLKQKGIEGHEYFKVLLDVERSLINNPVDTIKRLMEVYQVDKNSLIDVESQSDNDPESEYLDYDEELAKVKKELKAIKEREKLEKEKYQRNQQESTAKQILDFKYATDETGELKYPFFEDVKEEMGLLLNQGKAKTLEEAYNKSPTILLKAKEQELQKKAEDDIEKERERVAKAKRASTGLKSSKSGYNTSFSGSDLRSMLQDQLSKYQ